MKTISVSVSEEDYAAFERAAKAEGRSVAQLIREAMAFYRAGKLRERTALRELPLLTGHRPTAPLPGRASLYDEVRARRRD